MRPPGSGSVLEGDTSQSQGFLPERLHLNVAALGSREFISLESCTCSRGLEQEGAQTKYFKKDFKVTESCIKARLGRSR